MEALYKEKKRINKKASQISLRGFLLSWVEGTGQKSNFFVDFQEIQSRIEKIEKITLSKN
jgi:hypothetical protein